MITLNPNLKAYCFVLINTKVLVSSDILLERERERETSRRLSLARVVY